MINSMPADGIRPLSKLALRGKIDDFSADFCTERGRHTQRVGAEQGQKSAKKRDLCRRMEFRKRSIVFSNLLSVLNLTFDEDRRYFLLRMPRISQQTLNPLDILARLSWCESDDLEFKSAKGGLPGSFWETYSAMANTRGGVILLGVENDGSISGIKDISNIRKNFWDTINNRGKVSINLIDSNDVQEVMHSNGMIFAIRVPRASRYQGPVFIGQNPLTGTYRRSADGDYRCTEQEVGRMLADRSQEPADGRILEHFKMNDLDLSSLQQYRQRFASHKPTHPWLDEDDKGLLTKLNGWRSCRSSCIEGVTVAGLLMFGREEALREALPQYHIDFREKLSNDPAVRWTDRLTLDGTWSGNLSKGREKTQSFRAEMNPRPLN